MKKLYKPNWTFIVMMALAFHGLLFIGASVFNDLIDKTAPQTVSGGLIDLEDESGIGEIGYKEGAEDGSLLGFAEIGQGVTAISDKDISTDTNASAPETDITDEIDELPLTQEEALLTEEVLDDESPIVATNMEEAIQQYKERVKEAKHNKISNKNVVKRKGGGGHQMGQPPKVLETFYPAEGIGNFHGVIKVNILIGTDGKVTAAAVVVTSGKRSVDELAMSACRRWTFKPALDSHGEPMECYKIIGIPFNVSPRLSQIYREKNLGI